MEKWKGQDSYPNKLTLREISGDELDQFVKSLSSTTSTGLDGIPAKMRYEINRPATAEPQFLLADEVGFAEQWLE